MASTKSKRSLVDDHPGQGSRGSDVAKTRKKTLVRGKFFFCGRLLHRGTRLRSTKPSEATVSGRFAGCFASGRIVFFRRPRAAGDVWTRCSAFATRPQSLASATRTANRKSGWNRAMPRRHFKSTESSIKSRENRGSRRFNKAMD